VAIAALVSLLYVVDFVKDLGGDYTFYFSNGWFIHEGLTPYADFWTHKSPLLVMALGAWIGLVGVSHYAAVAFLIVTTILAAYAVFRPGIGDEIGRRVSILSATIFALFASLHTLDPDRHGIIIVFASIFELGALILLIAGLRQTSDSCLFLSGVLMALAVASRQTSLILYAGLLAIILVYNRAKAIRQAICQCIVVTLGCASAGALVVVYLLAHGVDAWQLWDQIVRFNILYTQGENRGFWASSASGSSTLAPGMD